MGTFPIGNAVKAVLVRASLAGILSGAALGSVAAADIIHLRDGSKLEGNVKHADDGWVVKNGTKVVHVATDQVESIELTQAASPSTAVANDRLASVRRSVEGLNDLTDIISRFQRFIDQNTDPTTGVAAKKDLALWQDRQQQKMVKVGANWVTESQKQSLVDQAFASAETARQLLKQGRMKEADPILANCLLVDPQNATALYLTGMIRFQQEQLPAARKAFESVAAVIPNHAPTLNNLGVTFFRQKQYIPALMNLDAAMLAAPINKIILDNVAVTFQNLPVELQKSPVTLKALRHFNEQDQQLSAQLARQGLHRYGSLWVTDQDLDQMKQQEKDIQAKLDQLSGDFDKAKERVDQLTQDISDNQSALRRMEANSYTIDLNTGAQIQLPLPSSYYELQRDNEKKSRELNTAVGKLDGLKQIAQNLQNSRPSLKNRGVSILIGVEGTPIKVPAAAKIPMPIPARPTPLATTMPTTVVTTMAATQPATSPATRPVR